MDLLDERTRGVSAVPDLQPHVEMLRRYLFVLGARADRLDDLAQEVFAVALKKQLQDRGPAALASFLRGVAKNLLLRDWQSAKKRREVELADEVWQDECGDGGEDLRLDALRRCLHGLPSRSRSMLQRAYVDRVGRVALGREFGLVVNGVKTALRRLRIGLRSCVEQRVGGES